MNEQNEYNMSLLGASDLSSHAWIQPSSLLFGHKRNISSSSLLSLPEMSLQLSISSEVELFGEPQELAIQEKQAKAGDFEHEDDADSEIKLTPPSTSFVVQGATIGRCCAKDQKIGEPKRSRTTQVHNASERRRRDKITEKIKALQDLMPHCRKKDKASVLEEEAHYVKTLQLQVETMTKTREEWIAKYNMQCVGTPCMMPYGATTIRPPPGPMMGMTFGQPPLFVPCLHALPISHSMLPGFPLPAAASLYPPPLPPATVTNSCDKLHPEHQHPHPGQQLQTGTQTNTFLKK